MNGSPVHLDKVEMFARRLRDRIVRTDRQECLLARMSESEESKDKYTLLNCDGIGRIRVFDKYSLHCGYDDPFFSKRAKSVLAPGFGASPIVRNQVFQLAACSWRCWYCYVDNSLLAGNEEHGRFISAGRIVEMCLGQAPQADMIDLSGGQSDLVPEWPIWVLRALDRQGSASPILLRSEDNLSNVWLWDHLTESELQYMASHPRYVRIGCLKGFDAASFSFNTGDIPERFDQQFSITRRLLESGFNLYLYATFTGRSQGDIKGAIEKLLDRLQSIHPDLPLRTMPLRIRNTPAMEQRHTRNLDIVTMETQRQALWHWQEGLRKRFDPDVLQIPVGDIPRLRLGNR